jgi:peptidoglycan/LPS O-acetylase OafA/YrhL
MPLGSNTVLSVALKRLQDAEADVRAGRARMAETNIAILLSVLDADPLRSLLRAFPSSIDFPEWYRACAATGGGMAGSARFNWPTDLNDRVACRVGLCRKVSEREQGFLHIATMFYGGSRDPNVRFMQFVGEVVQPLVRDVAHLATLRASPPVLAELLGQQLPPSGDADFDTLLTTARTKFLDPSPATRREALDKLCDAWERLKTLSVPNHKPQSVAALLDSAATGPFRHLLEDEAGEINAIENDYQIRHHGVGKTPITEDAHVDYLFHRIFAFVLLLLRARARPASTSTGNSEPKRIPSLDGIRAVAIALVVLAHLGGTRGFPLTGAEARWVGTGNLGVRIFFVLSGFLIAGLLLRQIDRTGTVSLSTFYLRRGFRIFPAYYLYLAVTALAAFLGWCALRPGDLLHAFTYTENYHADHAWAVGHAWSLSVEEQFYILWPAVLVLAGRSRGLRVAFAVVCLVPFIRFAEAYGPVAFHAESGYRFERVADALAVGVLLAGYRGQLWSMRWYRTLLTPRWIAVVAALVLVVAAQDRPRAQAVLGIPLMNLGIALMIDYFARAPAGAIGRVLNTSALRQIGVLSYSIYLWQQPFLDDTRRTWATTFPMNILLIAVCASASYYMVEAPCLSLRRWIEMRQIHGRADRAGLSRTAAAFVPTGPAGRVRPNDETILPRAEVVAGGPPTHRDPDPPRDEFR